MYGQISTPDEVGRTGGANSTGLYRRTPGYGSTLHGKRLSSTNSATGLPTLRCQPSVLPPTPSGLGPSSAGWDDRLNRLGRRKDNSTFPSVHFLSRSLDRHHQSSSRVLCRLKYIKCIYLQYSIKNYRWKKTANSNEGTRSGHLQKFSDLEPRRHDCRLPIPTGV